MKHRWSTNHRSLIIIFFNDIFFLVISLKLFSPRCSTRVNLPNGRTGNGYMQHHSTATRVIDRDYSIGSIARLYSSALVHVSISRFYSSSQFHSIPPLYSTTLFHDSLTGEQDEQMARWEKFELRRRRRLEEDWEIRAQRKLNRYGFRERLKLRLSN